MIKITDTAAIAKVRECIKRANAEGRDVAEYLAVYGWLATPSWQKTVELELMDQLIDLAERTSAAQLIGGSYATGQWTPADMRLGFLRLLEDFEEKIRTNG